MAFLSSHTYRKKITIDSTKIDSNLSDFPILVKLNNTNFDFTKARSDGFDIRFTESDGTTLLKYERERHDNALELAEYHVKVPTVSSTTNSYIYMYYDDPDASDGDDSTNVWDSNFLFVTHLIDISSSTVKNSKTGTSYNKTSANNPNQINGQIYKGQDFDSGEYIDLNADFNINGNGSIEAIVNPDSLTGLFGNTIVGRADNTGLSKYADISLYLSNTNGYVSIQIGDTSTYQIFNSTLAASISTWQYVAVKADGTNLSAHLNASNQTTPQSITPTSNIYDYRIGTFGQFATGLFYNGKIDEVRLSSSARSDAWMKGTYYSLFDQLITLGSEELENYHEFITDDHDIDLSENIEFLLIPKYIDFDSDIIFSENFEFDPSLNYFTSSEDIIFSEFFEFVHPASEPIFATDFRTLIQSTTQYATYLKTKLETLITYATKCYTKYKNENTFLTDLRLKYISYTALQPGNINDIIVKLDGVEITDIQYDSLSIDLGLNSSPSSASFILARYHDDLDHKYDGSVSEITDENKIEIYDGTIKLFTGYITEIQSSSEAEQVQVTAEDIRYKLNRVSYEIEYGGSYDQDENDPDKYNRFQKSIDQALTELFIQVDTYISGRDTLPFAGSHVPEKTKSYNTLGSLLDTLILNTANVNWYIDENERLRFQKIQSGSIKNLKLSSLNDSRHLYDILVNEINLNKQNSNYATAMNVKFGKYYNQSWTRNYYTGWLNSIPEFNQNLDEKVVFGFQQWGSSGEMFYVGINPTIYGYVTENGWGLKPTLVIQFLNQNTETDIADETVGAGSIKRTIYLESYGKKDATIRWEERNHPETDIPYLVYVQDYAYNNIEYAKNLALFDLSQSNQLETSARVDILLDAYHYYQINLSSRINIDNTIIADIYKNNNGFPLNIQSINIQPFQRKVTLNLTNYGKTWAYKSGNILTNQIPPSIVYAYPKQSVVKFTQGT